MGTKVLQLQSGIELNRVDTGSSEDESWINNNVVRFGLNEEIELSGVLDYRMQDSVGSGLDNYQLGGRINLLNPDESDWFPTLCIQSRVRFKGSGDFKRSDTGAVTIISAVKGLGDLGGLTVNYINDYNGSFSDSNHGYTVAWGYNFTDQWGAFIEEYATYTPSRGTSSSEWSHAIDTGFSYLANKDLMYDIAFGVDLEENTHQEYIAIGFSWRTL